MKGFKSYQKQRSVNRTQPVARTLIALDQTISSPELLAHHLKPFSANPVSSSRSISQSNLPAVIDVVNPEDTVRIATVQSPEGDQPFVQKVSGDMQARSHTKNRESMFPSSEASCKYICKQDHTKKCKPNYLPKKPGQCSPLCFDSDSTLSKRIREIHNGTRKSARIIRDSRARLIELQKKSPITESDVKELYERNELLLREMDRFDRYTKTLQKLVGAEVAELKIQKDVTHRDQPNLDFVRDSIYESSLYHETAMNHPTVLLAGGRKGDSSGIMDCKPPPRSKSEIDLTRKLSESYDMQEKLVADNADLEVKRYILYKELMTKDQNLETCRAQVKRLQGELKMMSKENCVLHEKLDRNNPQGDAADMTQQTPCESQHDNTISELNANTFDVRQAKEIILKLENYKTSTADLNQRLINLPFLRAVTNCILNKHSSGNGDFLIKTFEPKLDKAALMRKYIRNYIEKQLGELEVELRLVKVEMDTVKGTAKSACRGGGGQNTCFEQTTSGPPVPPMSRACGVCPPCPAPCNPNAPPTPAEKEVQKLTIQLRNTEENFKTKVTECAMLRAEVVKKKEELEKERCQHRETQNRLRELEMKFEGLATHTNMLMGSKEQAFEQEVNVRALKQCYREAREEIDELRILMKEQNDQLQDYRVKYLQAQQLVEEQRRQMDMLDMDNTRISEQINLEIQRVKLKFQEKLQELAPIPDLLKATQMRLKDAQQAQAIAEHSAEQLARELNCAREKVHVLLHNSLKPPEKPVERTGDEKQMALLNQRVAQLTETNMSLKSEIERLKANVIRMEESVLANEKRLQEKMHECAQLGGELDRARDEAARALQRANERSDTLRKCMQTTIAELERQLAASRAQVKNSEKEREELQNRMHCQIKRLNENFEQAQLRVMGLQTQVQTLRRTASSTGDGEGDSEQQECTCKTFFDNP